MANVRKLMRLAREFEADQGRDLRGFIDSIAERDADPDPRGGGAAGGRGARRRAADDDPPREGARVPGGLPGRPGQGRARRRRRAADLRRRQRRAAAGLGWAAGRSRASGWSGSRPSSSSAAEEEERRIFYVACTRAEEHLVLSGATDLEKRPEPDELNEPMRWVWRGFCAGLPAEGASGEHVDQREGREVRVRWTRCVPDTLDELLPEADRAPARLERRTRSGRGGSRLRAAQAGARRLARAAGAAGQPAQLLGPRGLPPLRLPLLPRARASACRASSRHPRAEAPPEAGPAAALRGSLVHELLEQLDFRRPACARATRRWRR